MYGALADLVLLAHAGFILFAAGGALLLRRVPRVAWLHLPAVVWGVAIEWSGGVCPLTPLEVWLRRQAGASGYRGGFIEHYVAAVIYPAGLTRAMQVALGGGLLLLNVFLYWRAWSARPGRGRRFLPARLVRSSRPGAQPSGVTAAVTGRRRRRRGPRVPGGIVRRAVGAVSDIGLPTASRRSPFSTVSRPWPTARQSPSVPIGGRPATGGGDLRPDR